MARVYNLALIGVGNVGRMLIDLLERKREALRSRYAIEYRITGIASRRLGWQAKPQGFAADELQSLAPNGTACANVREWLAAANADVLFEASSLNVETGQPAINHLRAALEEGAHAVSANKGPVVHAYRELTELAAGKNRRFLFESSVMDGIPIFSMFRRTLPVIELRGFAGILNSTTNVILDQMEAGRSFEEAVCRAQELGVAETDPRADIEGWDAAVKVSALVTVLMGEPLAPQQVQRQGIRDITAEKVRIAASRGERYKLICRARREATRIKATVAPELLPVTNAFAQVAGTSSIISFETDIFPALTITEESPGLDATAYGMLTDFITAVNPEALP